MAAKKKVEMKPGLPFSAKLAIPSPVDAFFDGDSAVYLYGSHEDALLVQKAAGGTVERRNLWAVVLPSSGNDTVLKPGGDE